MARKIWDKANGQNLSPHELLSFYRSELAVISLSRRINSGLLWSHYADGYRGIALHFTPSNNPKSIFGQSSFHWVTYEKQRALISIEQLRYYFDSTLQHPSTAFQPSVISAIELQFLSALLTWKSEDWSYEQEARLVTLAQDSTVAFSPNEIASVILGPRCPRETENKVRELVTKSSTPIAVARANLSRTDYSIEIDW